MQFSIRIARCIIKAVQENVIFEYISADTSVEISMSETRGRFIK